MRLDFSQHEVDNRQVAKPNKSKQNKAGNGSILARAAALFKRAPRRNPAPSTPARPAKADVLIL
jgi:hypothetical protein